METPSSQRVLGVVLPLGTLHFNDFYRNVLGTIQVVTVAENYGSLIYIPYSDEGLDWQRFLSSASEIVDGFLVVAPLPEDRFLKEINLYHKPKPAVLLFCRSPYFSSVCMDNEEAVLIAVKHLVNLGHKKIATISGDLRTYDGQERLKAYKQTLFTFGLTCPDKYVVEGEFDYASGRRGMTQLLRLPDRPTAVFAANDKMAIGAMEICREEKIRIPEDIAIVGCDDISSGTVFKRITTIRQPVEKIATEGVLLLIEEIEKYGQPKRKREISVRGELVVRESCGASSVRIA